MFGRCCLIREYRYGNAMPYLLTFTKDKPACLIIRVLFGFVSDSICQIQPNSETAMLTSPRGLIANPYALYPVPYELGSKTQFKNQINSIL